MNHHLRSDRPLLHHRALGSQIAKENGQAAGWRVGFGLGTDNRSIKNSCPHDIPANSLARYRHGTQVKPLFQLFHHRRYATRLVQVLNVVITGRP